VGLVTGTSSEIEGYSPNLPASRQPMPGPKREPSPVPRPPEAIEAEINATRARLASTLSELRFRTRPDTIMRRLRENAKAKLTTPSGEPRPEVIAAGVVFVLGFVFMVWRRRKGRD
jgi:hypothetical protein